MYQTVMILLVTAVLTIITTIVTVRVTMTGRVLSQEAKNRFSARARKYGVVLLYLFGLTINTYELIRLMRQTTPVDRVDILLISGTLFMVFAAVFGLTVIVAVGLVFRKWISIPTRADFKPHH